MTGEATADDDDDDAEDEDEDDDTGPDEDEVGSGEDIEEDDEAAAVMEAVIGQQNDKAKAGKATDDAVRPLLDAADHDPAEELSQVSTAPIV